MPTDVSARIYERDRAYFGSVLGSAVAFRLFLFMLSATALGVGIGTTLVNLDLLDDGVGEHAGLTGAVAVEVDQAFDGTQLTAWLLIASGRRDTRRCRHRRSDGDLRIRGLRRA